MFLACGHCEIECSLCGDWVPVPIVELSILSVDVDLSACLDVLIALDRA